MAQVFVLPDWIGSRSIGTGTAQTQLSGDRSGNATNYVVPAWTREMLYCNPKFEIITPTAGQTGLATLKFQSNDVNFGNYEVFAQPLGSVLGATATYLEGLQTYHLYPINIALNGGEQIQAFGQPQITNTAVPRLGATIWIANVNNPQQQVYSLITSKINNSSNPVSTGVSAATVLGTAATISGAGGAHIISVSGVIASGTIVASDTAIGFWQWTAPELPVPIRWGIEPIPGFLGATGQVWNYISRADNLAVDITTPSTLQPALVLEVAPANAGTFELGVMYQ